MYISCLSIREKLEGKYSGQSLGDMYTIYEPEFNNSEEISNLKDNLKTDRDIEDLEKTKTPTTFSYTPNNKKPFYTINKLSKKAIFFPRI